MCLSTIPEYFCDPSGTTYCVDKKRTRLVNLFIKNELFFDISNGSREDSRQSLRIPNFVSDLHGNIFLVNKRRTKLVNNYIYLSSIFASSADESFPDESTASYQPVTSFIQFYFPLRGDTNKPHQHFSKQWLIAIILKMLLVAWDLWTYRIGFKEKCLYFVNNTELWRSTFNRGFIYYRRNTLRNHK